MPRYSIKKRNIDRVKRALTDPREAVDLAVAAGRYGLIKALNRPVNLMDGVHLLDEDWDNLVLLDACRCDVFADVNTIEGDFECRTSLGSATPEFIQRNFAGRRVHDTILVSSNAMVGANADALNLFKVVGLWGDRDSKTEHADTNVNPNSIADPQPVLERAIELHQDYPDKRLIVHFLPPHTPFLVKDGEPLPPDSPYRTFDAVRRGDVTPAEMEEVYRENVAHVLDYVAEFLDAVDGKTVVTADHGELLGEGLPTVLRLLHPRWPFAERHRFDWAHYSRVRVPELVKVPWLEVDGERREVVAEDPASTEMKTGDLDDQLEALGYKT